MKNNFNEKLGIHIKKARLFRNMSQSRLGDIVGVSYQQIQKYESGKDRVSCETLHLIEEALNTCIYEFMSI